MKRLFTVFLSWISLSGVSAQRVSVEQYIQQYKGIAITEMKRMGIPAAITLAQAILESENGNGDLAKKSNNHFGIKCKNTWTGATVTHDDDAKGECFRSYTNTEESFRDHSNFLRNSTRYEFLFHLDAADYKAWAYGLKKAGYATNPSYPAMLIKNIEQYNLQQYTLAAIKDIPNFDASKYKDDEADEVNAQNRATDPKSSPDSSVTSVLDEPDKVIIINKSKCVLAKKGTSLLFIAVKNNINLNKILEFNEIAEDGILGKDQFIYLQKKQKAGEQEFAIVQPGQTVFDIAQQYGVQLQYLLDYNKLSDEDVVVAGTKIYLGSVNDNKHLKMQPPPKKHTVAAKEGLYAIAQKYKVTVQQLKEWNKLVSDELKIGQELIISK